MENTVQERIRKKRKESREKRGRGENLKKERKMRRLVDVPEGREKNEKIREPDVEEVPEPQPKKQRTESKNPSPVANTLSRGKYLVHLSNLKSKRKSQSEKKIVPAAKIPRKRVRDETSTVKNKEAPAFKEINRALLKVDKTPKIGSGTFGNCYIALYRNEFRVVAKEIKRMESSKQTKEEVLREAAAIASIGDHWGIPHLFGVCTEQAPHYLVLQFHAFSGILRPGSVNQYIQNTRGVVYLSN